MLTWIRASRPRRRSQPRKSREETRKTKKDDPDGAARRKIEENTNKEDPWREPIGITFSPAANGSARRLAHPCTTDKEA
jgi:hypothetical protein